jgi:hypothetical protein
MDFPIPLPAPVISADLPLSVISSLLYRQLTCGEAQGFQETVY